MQFWSARISSSEKPYCEEAPGSWPRSDLARGNRSDWSSERKLADDLLNKQLTLGAYWDFYLKKASTAIQVPLEQIMRLHKHEKYIGF